MKAGDLVKTKHPFKKIGIAMSNIEHWPNSGGTCINKYVWVFWSDGTQKRKINVEYLEVINGK